MNHTVRVAGPTRRPDDPFIREMGDAISGMGDTWSTLRERPNFVDKMLSDVQAEYVVRKTRRRDAVAAAMRFELRPTGWIHEATRRDPLKRQNTTQLMREYEVFDRLTGAVSGTFVATKDQAHAMLALLNRSEPPVLETS